jgi:hypothetical protein
MASAKQIFLLPRHLSNVGVMSYVRALPMAHFVTRSLLFIPVSDSLNSYLNYSSLVLMSCSQRRIPRTFATGSLLILDYSIDSNIQLYCSVSTKGSRGLPRHLNFSLATSDCPDYANAGPCLSESIGAEVIRARMGLKKALRRHRRLKKIQPHTGKSNTTYLEKQHYISVD